MFTLTTAASKPNQGFGKVATNKKRKQPIRTQIYKVARLLHVYLSATMLVVILFFSATGFLLNHPNLIFGSQPVTQEVEGILPNGWAKYGTVDWLMISDYIKQEHNVHGQALDYWSDDVEGQLMIQAPGYSAETYFDMQTGEYSLYTESQGMIAFIKDLHKGSNTGPSWNWLIDATALFLTLVSLTGLAIMLLLKKLRTKGLITIFGGSLIAMLIIVLSI